MIAATKGVKNFIVCVEGALERLGKDIIGIFRGDNKPNVKNTVLKGVRVAK